QTTKDNVEIANESAIISNNVSDIANNILEDVKKKKFLNFFPPPPLVLLWGL
ncbi:methyl-accepting chemotaxis protein, partial [Campylobacter helveticus]